MLEKINYCSKNRICLAGNFPETENCKFFIKAVFDKTGGDCINRNFRCQCLSPETIKDKNEE